LNTRTRNIFVLIVLAIVIIAAIGWITTTKQTTNIPIMGPEGPPPVDVLWKPPYVFGKQGYEPGLVSTSTGTLYYTAHKNLDDKTSWDYLASWFFVSTDNGNTWSSPTDPMPLGRKWQHYLGDEGDIGVDGEDNAYFVDTYLLDNHLHVWADKGQWKYSEHIQKSGGLDDRPWISAQGSGILHYLGNNAQEVNGGRYWYYRSTNGGRTWEKSVPVPGNGWGLVDAERNGTHAYIIDESDVDVPADILLYRTDDSGVTWNWNSPIKLGHRDGPGRGFPEVTAGPNGSVYAFWNDATNGTTNGTKMFIGWSSDYGKTWNSTNITPFAGFFDYPTLNAGPEGSLGVTFYATDDLPVSDKSAWYIMGGMQRNAIKDPVHMNFSRADPHPVYVGSDLHALHDLMECAVGPDGYLNVAYQYYVGPANGHSDLYFVRGTLPSNGTA
jgi:hypothetical protein